MSEPWVVLGLALGLAWPLASGCQDTRGSGGPRLDAGIRADGGGQADGGSVDPALLRELSALSVQYVNLEPPPAAGQLQARVEVELTNGAEAPSAPLSFGTFAVRTRAGLEVTGSPATTSDAEGCPADASVAPGATQRCAVVFDVPETDAPIELLYLAEPSARADLSALSESPQGTAHRTCSLLFMRAATSEPPGCSDCIYGAFTGECGAQYDAADAACESVLDCATYLDAGEACTDAANALGECVMTACALPCGF